MPGLINRYPRGLLGLLDAKTNGKTPEALADLVMPILDMSPFYLAQIRELVPDDTGAVAGVGFMVGATGRLVVPSDQLWYITHFSVNSNATLAAGETLGIVPMLRGANTIGANSNVDMAPALTAGQGPNMTARSTSQGPFFAMPGDTLAVWIYQRVVYAGTIRLDAALHRFQI